MNGTTWHLCSYVWLISLNIMLFSPGVRISFFSRQSNISGCLCTPVPVHSHGDGHLGWLCLRPVQWAMVNSGVQMPLRCLFPLDVYPTVGLLEHLTTALMDALFSVFNGHLVLLWFVSLLFCAQHFNYHRPLDRYVYVRLVSFQNKEHWNLASVASSGYGCLTKLRSYTISHS